MRKQSTAIFGFFVLSVFCVARCEAGQAVDEIADWLEVDPGKARTLAACVKAGTSEGMDLPEAIAGRLAETSDPNGSRRVLLELAIEMKGRTSYPASAYLYGEYCAWKQSSLNRPQANADFWMDLFRTRIASPEDEVTEIHIPTGLWKQKVFSYSAAKKYAESAQRYSMSAKDQRLVQKWIERATWCYSLGDISGTPGEDFFRFSGRLVIDGQPKPFCKVALISAQKGFFGLGGGYRTYVQGLDTGRDIHEFPENGFAYGTTDQEGRFSIAVDGGGVYDLVVFPVSRAVSKVAGVDVTVDETSRYFVRGNGWDLPSRTLGTSVELGDVNVQIRRGEQPSVPLLGVTLHRKDRQYEKGERIRAFLRLQNCGAEDLSIREMTKSCTCTSVTLYREVTGGTQEVDPPLTLPPGAHSMADVSIDTRAGTSSGKKHATVMFHSNDVLNPNYLCSFDFNLMDPITLSPPFLRVPMRESENGWYQRKIRLVYNSDDAMPKIAGIRVSDPERLHVQMMEDRQEFTVAADIASFSDTGQPLTATVTVDVDRDGYQPLILPILVSPETTALFRPASFHLRSVDQGQEIIRKVKVIDPSRVKQVTGVSCSGSDAEVMKYNWDGKYIEVSLQFKTQSGASLFTIEYKDEKGNDGASTLTIKWGEKS